MWLIGQPLEQITGSKLPSKKEEVFKDRLTDLFDVSHLNALQIIKIDEYKKFLLAQREKGRKSV